MPKTKETAIVVKDW